MVTKNFLRFSKGSGFKEISLKNENLGIENTNSEFFLNQIRNQLITKDKTTKDFMNMFFNSLNDLTTEVFVIFKDLKNSFNP